MADDRDDAAKSIYETAWDAYAAAWHRTDHGQAHLGDEWTGRGAGAAGSLPEYLAMIRDRFILPWIDPGDTVLEIGVGGGRTAVLLLERCRRLVCADVSGEMLELTRRRLLATPAHVGRCDFVKLNGRDLAGVADGTADVCFAYDTLVHVEPRDIFNYLSLLPRCLRGRRRCILHHANVTSPLGFRKFLAECRRNIGGTRHGLTFSIMTPEIMQRFLDELGYRVLLRDSRTVPRDCVWVCEAPEPA